MNFCNNCDNMYYIKLSDDEQNLINYCRNCGNTDVVEKEKCVLKDYFNNNKNIIDINKYTKMDVTLPRINYIKCPNAECLSNKLDFDTNKREIIYIRYDNIELKFIYLCSHCDYNWKTEKSV